MKSKCSVWCSPSLALFLFCNLLAACGSRGSHDPASIRASEDAEPRTGTGTGSGPAEDPDSTPVVLREVPAFKVVGYAPSWQGSATAIPYAELDFINYSFALPLGDGTLRPIDGVGKLKTIVTRAHAVGTRVLIAVGGWNNGDDSPFVELTANPDTLDNFVENLLAIVETYKLDGVDLDWEYPDAEEASGFVALTKQLSERLKPQGKYLTAAVAAGRWGTDGVTEESFQYLDFINIMAYDGTGGGGASHSPISLAEGSLEFWIGKGLPKEKAVLGVPFYGRPGHTAYSLLVARDPAAAQVDEVNGEYYNGIPTIKAKTSLALDKASGIMIWELSQDARGELSLLNAIKQTAAGAN